MILWKAPLVDEPEDAEALLRPWNDRGDAGAFEASEAIKRCADALLRRFPDGPETEGSPWAEPFRQTPGLLALSLRPDVGDEVTDEIADLAYEHGLMLYDPQGPYLFPPDDFPEEETRPPGPADYVRFALFGLGSLGLLALGQWLTIPFLDSVLTAFGGFLTAVFVFVLVMFIAQRGWKR